MVKTKTENYTLVINMSDSVHEKKRMTTFDIVDHHKELRENWMQYLVWAMPFKDEKKNEDLELAKKMLTKFEEKKWVEQE